jgi:solute carrier family 25 carnitine/acylcarnitine transporter 20/29
MSTTTPQKDNAFIVGLKDIFAGSLGGVAQVLSGHPLDTVKVRLQTQTSLIYTGTIDCLSKTIKEEGFKGLYKGVQSPLVGLAVMNSVMFLAYGQAKDYIQKDKTKPLTLAQYAQAGAFAGICISFVECPIDLFKSQMQVQYGAGQKYSGIADCAKQIVGKHGIKGAYQGLMPTFLRDVPSNASYFVFYELARKLMVKEGQSVSDLPAWKVMIAGATGGVAYWGVTYPTDVIKSTIQTDNIDPSQRKYHGIADTARKIYASNGFKGFFKGFTPCIIRSIPANAACFVVYEQVRKLTG